MCLSMQRGRKTALQQLQSLLNQGQSVQLSRGRPGAFLPRALQLPTRIPRFGLVLILIFVLTLILNLILNLLFDSEFEFDLIWRVR